MPEIKIYKAQEHASLMDAFMSEAQAAGLMNNANPKILKLDRMQGKDGYYWITLENGRIVSMSGVQHLPEIGIGVDRLMFRTATLPDFRSAARPDCPPVCKHRGNGRRYCRYRSTGRGNRGQPVS
jgi:hypothetical protein